MPRILTVFVNFSSTKRPVCDDCNDDVIRSLKSVKGFWVGIAAGWGNDSRDNTKSDFEPKRQIYKCKLLTKYFTDGCRLYTAHAEFGRNEHREDASHFTL